MLRGEFADKEYKPQFSGHETFPLRYGWLKKAYDEVAGNRDKSDNKSIFFDKSAIATFGVGKNMVDSMRHWALALDIIELDQKRTQFKTTTFGDTLFCKERGLDPYLERPSSLWALHWKLCSKASKTTWHYAFNHCPSDIFDREGLLQGILKIKNQANWAGSKNTIKRDVDCFIRTYAARPIKNKEAHEDALESPLVELSLIRSAGGKDLFRFVRGRKPSLADGVFLFALVDFWNESESENILSFEKIMHEPGSPGRVFLLNEDDLADRLARLSEITSGNINWSETAGLRQLIRTDTVRKPIDYLTELSPALKSKAA